MYLSVVIPAFNESENIPETLAELQILLKQTSCVDQYEIIVVDDHSSDKTFEAVAALAQPEIKAVRLSRKSGSHVAIRAGLTKTSGDAALCISADGQEDITILRKMLDKWTAGAQVIWGLRMDRKGEQWLVRKLAELFYRLLLWLGHTRNNNIDIARADFFLLDNTVVRAINACPERNTSLMGLLVWLGYVADFVEYERRPRRHGFSRWSLKTRFHLAKDWIVAFSGIPLKLISMCGFCVAIIGFLYGIYVIINAIVGNPASGWSSIMVAIFLLGGVQMIMLGIMGEYLWRCLDETRNRPLFFIEKEIKL